MPSVERPIMQGQMDILVDDCGFATTVVRPTKTQDAQGQFVEGDVDIVVGEIMWIQPARGNSEVLQANLNERTTHLLFQKFVGTPLAANDRLTQTVGTFIDVEFDVQCSASCGILNNQKVNHRAFRRIQKIYFRIRLQIDSHVPYLRTPQTDFEFCVNRNCVVVSSVDICSQHP